MGGRAERLLVAGFPTGRWGVQRTRGQSPGTCSQKAARGGGRKCPPRELTIQGRGSYMMTLECVLSDQEVRRPKREPQTGGAAGGGKGGEVGWRS